MSEDAIALDIEPFALSVPALLRGISPTIDNLEIELFSGLSMCLEPGEILFEMGTYAGVLSTWAAKLVGERPGGKVVVFEASQVSIQRASDMFESNDVRNVEIVQAYIADRSGDSQRFFAIDSGSGAALQSADPSVSMLFPEAREILVPTLSIDDWVATHGIRPDVLKIDIEGAECLALRGMTRFLSEFTPEIVLEFHCHRIPAIGGSVLEMFGLLDELGYGYVNLDTGELSTSAQLILKTKKTGHALCSTSLRKPSSDNRALALLPGVLAKQRAYRVFHEMIQESRVLVNEGKFEEARSLLLKLDNIKPNRAATHYLLAYTSDALRESPQVIFDHYDIALALGFDEFWTLYHRGSTRLRLGQIELAKDDLQRAFTLNPDHPGLKNLMATFDGR